MKQWTKNEIWSLGIAVLVFVVDLFTRTSRFSISQAILLFILIWIVMNQYDIMIKRQNGNNKIK